ncbi:MAG: hypothetical protein JRI25_12030, partial [Deltaproteobacteria bacterium]|nr:hypothetical protein [Deltaproteobacteria bacterium]
MSQMRAGERGAGETRRGKGRAKRILYCGCDRPAFGRLVTAMGESAGVEPEADSGEVRFPHPRAELTWVPAFDAEEALSVLRASYVNLVLIDLR